MKRSLLKLSALPLLTLVTSNLYADNAPTWGGIFKQIISLPVDVAKEVATGVLEGAKSSVTYNNQSSSSGTTTNSYDSESNIDPIVVGNNKDIIRIDNNAQAMLFAMAYYADHDPSKLTPENVTYTLDDSDYRVKYMPDIQTLLDKYTRETNVFTKQQLSNQLTASIKPYYQKYRGFSKVIVKAPVSLDKNRLSISHYDLKTKSFYIDFNPSDPRAVCHPGGFAELSQSRAFGVYDKLKISTANFDQQTDRMAYDKNNCIAYIPDQNLANKIESLISSNQLKNKDISVIRLSKVSKNDRGTFYFQALQEVLQITDPATGNVLYSKRII